MAANPNPKAPSAVSGDATRVATSPHLFWNTQPVVQEGEPTSTSAHVGPIDPPKTVDEVPAEPYPLASNLEWHSLRLDDDGDMQALYELLRDNYVEDHESVFRFRYSAPFLRWAMTPPGYHPDWHVAVRKKADKTLLAFVSGIPLRLRMGTVGAPITGDGGGRAAMADAEARDVCEINFLCVHKVLRRKKLTPLLIREVTRRVNRRNVWQAVYTAGVRLPTPFAVGQYYHRAIDPMKLIAVRFSRMPRAFEKFNNPEAALKRHYALPAEPKLRGLRRMEQGDVKHVWELLCGCLKAFPVGLSIDSVEAAAHWLLPREGVVFSYVVPGGSGDSIVAFTSFYALPSSIVGNAQYPVLNAAYSYYYASAPAAGSSGGAGTEQWHISPLALIQDALIMAKREGFDVFNTVDVLRNGSVVNDLKFALGDGQLHYYFYNWRVPSLAPDDVGLVML